MTRDLGQPIAYGRTAEIYVWHRSNVLKLFYEWFELENIEKEARISRAIHASGLPAPAVSEIIRVKGRYGLIYERIDGISMFKLFQQKPWNGLYYARRWAELQAMVHATRAQSKFPSQRLNLQSEISRAEALPAGLQLKALAALDAMPDGECLCHGDFWPGNILVTAKGEMIIDWIHASRGNPLADVARSTNLTFGFLKTRQSKRRFLSYGSSISDRIKTSLLQNIGKVFYPVYLNHYFRLCPGDRNEYIRWLPIVAAARLSDNIPELEKMLLAQVENNL